MPFHTASTPEIKQLYIDDHFGYAYKIGIVTNDLAIIRHLVFYNKDVFQNHPEIIIEKKSASPDEDKSVHNARLLIPTLQDDFLAHPLINPKTFLGDAAFDFVKLYKDLLSGDTFSTDSSGNSIYFSKTFIVLNSRAKLEREDYTLNENGIPCCPHDSSLPMKPEGMGILHSGVIQYKFSCPKVKWAKNPGTGKHQRQCQCQNPCSDSTCGRMIYLYPEKDLRTYPSTLRSIPKWDSTYKIRISVERSINQVKDFFGLADRKTQNKKLSMQT